MEESGEEEPAAHPRADAQGSPAEDQGSPAEDQGSPTDAGGVCLTNNTVTPTLAISKTASNTSVTRMGAKPREGSSNSSKVGLDINARPMADI